MKAASPAEKENTGLLVGLSSKKLEKTWVCVDGSSRTPSSFTPDEKNDFLISYTDFTNSIFMAQVYLSSLGKPEKQRDTKLVEYLKRYHRKLMEFLNSSVTCVKNGGKVVIKHDFKSGVSAIYMLMKNIDDIKALISQLMTMSNNEQWIKDMFAIENILQ